MSDTTINRLTMAKAEGKRLRKKVAREDHATLELPKHRDVLDLIHQRNKGRIPELIPVRMQRMSASAFAFFRGSADLMAYDLTASPTIGLNMVLCGDAHLANFGLFASPERRVLFDLNDFDESGIGPWEWDIKRLAASAVLAAREGDVHADDDDARDIVINLVDNYRTAMANLAEETILDRYYAGFNMLIKIIGEEPGGVPSGQFRKSIRQFPMGGEDTGEGFFHLQHKRFIIGAGQ